MDPTTIFCPTLACPARGHIGQGNRRIHSRQDRRFICTVCHKTFSATQGTAFYRLRTSAETVSLVVGAPTRVETLRRRSQGAGVINTAYIERLNATFRERLAVLTRRGRALARRTVTLQYGMYLMGMVYHFCTPHASLASVGDRTTPAMAAGITEHGWTVRELLAFQVPPPRWTPPMRRGRRSQALQRFMTR